MNTIPSSSSGLRRQLRARFQDAKNSDGNDGVLCTICDLNEPEGVYQQALFFGLTAINVAHGSTMFVI